MAIIQITEQDTLENYRVKSNQVYSTVGNLTSLTQNAVVTFTGIIGINADDFTGTPAQFTISTNASGGYDIGAITISGSGYAVNDTILVKGSDLGGDDTTHDATITITAVDPGFGVDGASISGSSKASVIAEINQLRTERDAVDTYIGDRTLPGSDTTLTDSLATLRTDIDSNDVDISDHESRLQSVEDLAGISVSSTNLDTTATNVVDAINEVNTIALDAQAEIGGDMATNYDGDDTTIISALNNLFASSSVSTLNGVYVRRDGVGAMTGVLTVSDAGIDSGANSLLLKTNGSTFMTTNTSGNIGIGKPPGTTKVDVSGTVKATAFNENGATLTATYAGLARNNAMSGDNTFTGSNTFTPAAGKSLVVTGTTIASDSLTITEWVQDTAGNMFESNSESGGISAAYNDTTGKITLAIANNSHNHVVANITDFTESVQDTVGAMFASESTAIVYDDTNGRLTFSAEYFQDVIGNMVASPNTEQGITVAYDDNSGKLNFDVNDFTVTLSGDVSGTATVTNLGSITISTTVSNDSHNHDGRYYTEAEADARFLRGDTSDTLSGNLTVTGDIYVGQNGGSDSDLYFYDDNSDTWRGIRWADSANAFQVEDNGGSYRTVVHSGNLSSFTFPSATNANTLDSLDSSQFLRSDANDTATGNLTLSHVYARSNNAYDIGASGTRFRTMFAGTFDGRATSANYADLAEKYLADNEYPVGTVIAVGGSAEVTAADMYNAHSVLGVVSEQPGLMLNSDLEGGTYIALKGRVPVTVTGRVRKGDRLAPSAEAGIAVVDNDRTAWSFAIALEDSDTGTVEAVIL